MSLARANTLELRRSLRLRCLLHLPALPAIIDEEHTLCPSWQVGCQTRQTLPHDAVLFALLCNAYADPVSWDTGTLGGILGAVLLLIAITIVYMHLRTKRKVNKVRQPPQGQALRQLALRTPTTACVQYGNEQAPHAGAGKGRCGGPAREGLSQERGLCVHKGQGRRGCCACRHAAHASGDGQARPVEHVW